MLAIEWCGEELALLAERAAYWPRRQMLIVADLHVGKAAAFRAAGIPVPEASTHATLARLGAALERSAAARLVILGDLFHARSGQTAAALGALTAWRATRPHLEIVLTSGNHDVHAGAPPEELNIRVVAGEWRDGPLAFRHDPPADDPLRPTLCGHVHPAVGLHGRAGVAAALPCFYFRPRVGILPALGEFTGTARVCPRPGERVYAVADEEVVPLCPPTQRAPG